MWRRGSTFVLSGLTAVAMGVAAGMLSSQLLWGYLWKPPRLVDLDGTHVANWAMAIYPRESQGEPVVFSVPERNQKTAQEDSFNSMDRTWGWALSPWDVAYLGTRPLTDATLMRRTIDWAYRVFEDEVGRLQLGRAVVLFFSDGGVGVVLMTGEVEYDRYVVWMVSGRYEGGRFGVVSTDRYLVEISGLEFLRPPVLVTLWTVVFSAVAVLLHLLRRLSRIGRRP